MGYPAMKPTMNAQDYLAWEDTQLDKHEFVNGEIVDMAGAEERHVVVSMNVAFALRQHLSGTPCRAYMAEMKLWCATQDSYFYPDVMVTCSAADHANSKIKHEPLLLVEVLSPSTAAYDRGAKFAHYRQIESLQELAFIDPDTRCTDVYRRGADGLWVLHPFQADEGLEFASVKLRMSAPTLFADLDAPSAPG